jgi:hypothetical protein
MVKSKKAVKPKQPKPRPKVSNPRRSQPMRYQPQPVYAQPQPPQIPKFADSISGAGAAVGHKIGSFLSGIFGMGAYKIKQNSVMNSISQQVPFMHSSSESVTFRHREYIADISSTAAFTTTVYYINPGLAATFPYLSSIAQNFQEYEFKGLVFEFKSLSASALNSTNTALGSIAMAAQYRSDATNFVDKQQLLNEMWSADAKPCDDFMLPIECAPAEKPINLQYVRGTSVPSGQDAKMYDLAKLTVASYGSQATSVVGELWATYEVVLRKPQLSSGLNLYGQSAHYTAPDAVVTTGYLGVTRTSVFDSIGLTLTGTVLTLPVGCQGLYQLTMTWSGVAASVAKPSYVISPSTASLTPIVPKFGGFLLQSPVDGVSSATFTIVRWISITDPTAATTITFSAGTLPTATCVVDIFVNQLNLAVT